ncbi:MAG: TolC family protein, partial [Limisphaerales bacterium]
MNQLAVSQSLLRLEWVIAGVLLDVERTYLNLISDLERVAVQEKAVELAERLLMENKKRVEIGTMAPLD